MRHRLCVVATSLLALALPACSRGPGPAAVLGRVTTTTEAPPPPIAFVATSFDLEAAAPPAAGAVDAARAAVLATLGRYLEEAVLRPLRSGGPAGDLAPLFTGPAAERVARGPDRAAFIDEGLPPLRGLRAEDSSLALAGLVDPDGRIVVVVARMTLRLAGRASGTPVTVERSGELALVEDGGAWRIDGYELRVARDTPTGATTTTARR